VAFGPEGRIAAGYDALDQLRSRRGGVVVFDARGERLRPTLAVKGYVRCVAFGPEGRIAAGYDALDRLRSRGGVVVFDARGERLRPAPLEVKEGAVTSVAFGPDGRIAAGYDGGRVGGGVVVFDARGEELRPAPLEVKEGRVTGVAFGPEGRIAAGYEAVDGGRGGVVVFDARGERLRPAPLEVKEGAVTGVAFGPDGRIATSYFYHFAIGGVVVFDARGERVRPAPLAVKETSRVTGVAFGPEGRIAAGYAGLGFGGGVVVFDARGERVRPAPLAVKEGSVTGVAFGPEGRIAAGYHNSRSGRSGVVVFDADWSRPGQERDDRGRRQMPYFQERDDNGLMMAFCWCPPGTFLMGSPKDEPGRFDNEGDENGPVSVTLSRDFWMGKFEVTQAQWQIVMGTTLRAQMDKAKPEWRLQRNEANPQWGLRGESPDRPIYYVSYLEAAEFCRRFTESERRAGRLPAGWEYRLPTEAEWEYACRAGTTTRYSFGDDEASLGEFAWYRGNSDGTTHPVGQKHPNRWGLHDMHGNVWEWCADGGAAKLAGGVDPRGPARAPDRVCRGGGWAQEPRGARSAIRSIRYRPGHRGPVLGFRLARVQSVL
jgi:formylglycine-generating enzyme required for sulfatase activity